VGDLSIGEAGAYEAMVGVAAYLEGFGADDTGFEEPRKILKVGVFIFRAEGLESFGEITALAGEVERVFYGRDRGWCRGLMGRLGWCCLIGR